MIDNKIIIFDISFYQDDDNTPYKVDFSIMKSQGGDGVILRAGQNTWLDEDYLDYCINADKINFPRGAYWFYDSRSNPKEQANRFADIVEMSGFPQLGIWGDYEETYNGAYKGQTHFKAFMDQLRVRFPGKLIGIYTGPSYWNQNTTGLFAQNFVEYPLWIAHYKTDKPTIPSPWNKYLFWQYTDVSDGNKFGVESKELDTNLFSGTLEDYKRYFVLEDYIPGEVPEQGEAGMYKVKSSQYKMTLRDTNSIYGAATEPSLQINIEMIADRIEPQSEGGQPGDKWAHVVSVGGISKNAWVAIIHNGAVYCTYEIIETTPTSTKHVVEVFIDGVLEFSKELE